MKIVYLDYVFSVSEDIEVWSKVEAEDKSLLQGNRRTLKAMVLLP